MESVFKQSVFDKNLSELIKLGEVKMKKLLLVLLLIPSLSMGQAFIKGEALYIESSGYALGMGYKFNKYLSAEGMYFNSSIVESVSRETISFNRDLRITNDGAIHSSQFLSNDSFLAYHTTNNDGIELNGALSLPLTPSFGLRVKGGYFNWGDIEGESFGGGVYYDLGSIGIEAGYSNRAQIYDKYYLGLSYSF